MLGPGVHFDGKQWEAGCSIFLFTAKPFKFQASHTSLTSWWEAGRFFIHISAEHKNIFAK